jgi:SHS2 domain-containing protein
MVLVVGGAQDEDMNDQPAGFRELEHTADWELEVWAPDLVGLLEQAAQGMYALAGLTAAPGPRSSHDLELKAPDPEALLVKFLAELLYLEADQGLVFDRFDFKIVKMNQAQEYKLSGCLNGAPAAFPGKDIKAVTYHKMHIEQGSRGFEVRIVFDV